jgi:hypothetical protein
MSVFRNTSFVRKAWRDHSIFALKHIDDFGRGSDADFSGAGRIATLSMAGILY